MTVTSSGLTFTRRLGAGGEAEVYEVAQSGLACKRYRQPTPARAAKLRVMLASPPEGTDDGGHVAIAWPTDLVVGPGGEVEGFLMRRIDLAVSVPLFQVYNPQSRVAIAPAFTWRYLLRTARNVAAIVDSLHRADYVVGDINESNLLVNRRALVALVDCDSMQVRDPATGMLHRSGVGKPEFTAPELHGLDLAATDRTTATDDFALAILIFQLLMEGVHPFAGVWRGKGEPPDIATRMRHGHLPYRRGGRLSPPPRALSLSVLPPELRRMLWHTFTVGTRRPAARPTAARWVEALERADGRLRPCPRSPHHVFSGHRRRCPWCERLDAGLPDPYPGPGGRSTLVRLPPPRRVRVRRKVAATMEAGGRRAGRATVAVARNWSAAAWRRIGPPLCGPVPVAVLLAAAGAGFPVVAPMATTLIVPLVLSLATPGARLNALRANLNASLLGLSRTIPAGGAAAVAALWFLSHGRPPVRATVATTLALVTVLQGLVWPATRPAWAEGRRRLASIPTAARWVAALAAGVAFVVTGPSWWPLPAP